MITWDFIWKSEVFLLCLDSLCLFAVIFLHFKNVCFWSCPWQLIVTGRFHPSARPKLISWCSRKLRLSSSSTSSSSLGFTHHPTVWTLPTSTRSPSGTLAASLVWSSLSFLESSKCFTQLFNETKMSFQLLLTTRRKVEFCSSTEQSSTATATVATC